MKKLLKCFIPLFLIAVLSVSPITANAATWQCIADYSSDTSTYKVFEYTPPLFIGVGQIGGLPNNANNGGFLVKAGQKIVVSVMFSTMCSCKISLVNQSTGQFVDSYDNFLGNSTQLATVVSETGYYVPIIQAQNSPIPEIPSSTNVQTYTVVVNMS